MCNELGGTSIAAATTILVITLMLAPTLGLGQGTCSTSACSTQGKIITYRCPNGPEGVYGCCNDECITQSSGGCIIPCDPRIYSCSWYDRCESTYGITVAECQSGCF